MNIFLIVQFFILKFIFSNLSIQTAPSELDNLDPNKKFFQGDITQVNFETFTNFFTGAVLRRAVKWDKGTVFYVISKTYTQAEKNEILNALRYVEDVTRIGSRNCIKFLPKTNQKNFVRITKQNGCWSDVGRNPTGSQDMSLGDGCVFKGIVAHEFLHVLGMLHEQSRPDRDNFIKINFENIVPEAKFNFEKMKASDIDTSEPYDVQSIMHYGPTAFSKNGKPTIESRRPGVVITGQRDFLTKIDIKEIRKMYNCV